MSEKLHTVIEVATRLRVSERTIRRYVSEGKITSIAVGRRVRIEESEVKRFLDLRRRARVRNAS